VKNKQTKQKEKENLNLQLGRPEGIRRPTTQRSPSPAPAFVSAADERDPRVIDTKQGRRHATARRWSSSPTVISPTKPTTPTCTTWWTTSIGTLTSLPTDP